MHAPCMHPKYLYRLKAFNTNKHREKKTNRKANKRTITSDDTFLGELLAECKLIMLLLLDFFFNLGYSFICIETTSKCRSIKKHMFDVFYYI